MFLNETYYRGAPAATGMTLYALRASAVRILGAYFGRVLAI